MLTGGIVKLLHQVSIEALFFEVGFLPVIPENQV